ncbi:hypothetical protein [Deinococcus sp.]|uniref:hypothetical protein n=1 Tax=Deinococcus sp. TaxID=47478 RepID=UPI003B5A648C
MPSNAPDALLWLVMGLGAMLNGAGGSLLYQRALTGRPLTFPHSVLPVTLQALGYACAVYLFVLEAPTWMPILTALAGGLGSAVALLRRLRAGQINAG